MITAKEFVELHGSKYTGYCDDSDELMIQVVDSIQLMKDFAKYHVQEALKQAYDKVEIGKDLDIDSDTYGMIGIKKDSILNAYPLENIK